MTLKEAKDKALKLMDEYSSRGTPSEDPDLKLKLNDFFDIAQKHMAQIKKIPREYMVPVIQADIETQYEMPEDFMSFSGMLVNGKHGNIGRWMGSVLILPPRAPDVVVQYSAYPQTIGANTLETYKFEISKDAQEAMPYWVAAQPLIAEPFVIDYKDLMAMYDRMVANLETRTPGVVRVVVL